MDNLKYSLKTHQFGKKRYHIFQKQSEKQSMSLQVHEPNHNVSHLLQMNRSGDQSGVVYSKQNYDSENQQKQLQQQIKTVKLPKQPPRNNINQLQKPKNISHSIHTTQQIKLPLSISQQQPPYSQSHNTHHAHSYQQSQQQLQQSLQQIQLTLYSNQNHLNKLVDSINSLYRNTIDLYNNHQRKLKELVNNRCYHILRIFKHALGEIQKKETVVDQLDNRITVLGNTLKENKESLRITRIKQECIQALQKEQELRLETQRKEKVNALNLLKEAKEKKASQPMYAVTLNLKNRNNKEFERMQSSKYIDFSLNQSPPKRIISKEFSMITCNDEPYEFVQSFISSPALGTTGLVLQQKSPFQANELYQISSTVPIMTITQPPPTPKQTEYSFRKTTPQYPTHPKLPTPIPNTTTTTTITTTRLKQKKSADNLSKLQSSLSQLMQGDSARDIWVDNLNCLRRRNGTYILDQFGNAIICSEEELRQFRAII